jgi:arylsulfatase A-like enzyme
MRLFSVRALSIGWLLIGFAGLAQSGSAADTAGAGPRRPNILFIITDQQPIPTLGAYGNSQIKTPHIDRLAREGMRFDQFHIAAFACSPSRACYWTGRWAHHHGIITNDVVLRDDIPTLGSICRAAGYQAAFVGKWHLGGEMYVRSDADKKSYRRVDDPSDFAFTFDGPWRGGEDQPQCGFLDKWVGGWSHYHAHLHAAGLDQYIAGNRRIGNHNMAPSGAEGTHIYSKLPAEHHEAAFLSGEAERFILQERQPGKPFCLVLSIYGPHLPVAPPRPWDTMYDPAGVPLPDNFRDDLSGKPLNQQHNTMCRKSSDWSAGQFRDYIARYWGYCSYIDQQVGRVLKALEDQKILDDTIVIYTTDHGDMLAAHGMIYKLNSGYDELMRVPFLLRYPRAVRPGSTNAALVESIDVLPTLLELCGVAAPAGVDGRSFRAILDGKRAEFRDQVVTEMLRTLMLATRDWKLVYSHWNDSGPFVELYDRHARPLEVDNLAGDPARAAVFKDMKNRLLSWARENGHPYAAVIEERLAAARTHAPRDEELLIPRVAAVKPAKDHAGRPVAEFTIEWNVGQAPVGSGPQPAVKYWTFVQVLGPEQRAILTRATVWPDPPTTAWSAGTKRLVGPLPVPIVPGLQGTYSVRVGLYDPQTKTRPAVLGEGTRIVGRLTVAKAADGPPAVSFEPEATGQPPKAAGRNTR